MSPVVRTVLADDIGAAIVAAASECDLLILGLSRIDRARRLFSETTRIVIASTEGSTKRIKQLREYGAVGYVRKPFQPEQLLEVLKPLLGVKDHAETTTGDLDGDFF